MTVRWKFEHLCTAFIMGCVVGLVVGTRLYHLFVGG